MEPIFILHVIMYCFIINLGVVVVVIIW